MISLSRTKLKNKRASPCRESPLPPTRFATAFANLLLALSSGWALRKTGGFQSYQFSAVSFSIFLLHSILGVVRFGNPQYGELLRPLYQQTSFFCIILALPCYSAQLAVLYSMPFYIMVLIGPALFVAFFHYIMNLCVCTNWRVGEVRSVKSKLVSLVVLMSLVFAFLVSNRNSNYYGTAATIAYAHTYFIVGPTGTAFNLPAVDLFVYELAFFNYFAVKALLD